MRKVEVETLDAVRRRLAVEVPKEEVQAEVDRVYGKLRRTARVPGFRPGRAPQRVLERLFGDQVRGEVFSKLIGESYREVLEEKSIEPLGQPEIVTEQAQPGQPLRYSVTVEVMPEVALADYTGLEAERPLRSTTDEDVDRSLERLRESMAQLQPIEDREDAQAGDVATLDYEARCGHRLMGRGEDRLVNVEGDGPPEDLGSHLVALRVGEMRSFAVDYPADASVSELAGKRVEFQVRLKAIARKEVPRLDDEFAKDHGECDTLDELRENLRRRMEDAAARDADRALQGALLDRLVKTHDVAVPRVMVERRAAAMVDEFLASLGPRRPPASREAEVRERIRAEVEPRARDRVKAELILGAIADHENIEVGDREVDARVRAMEEQAGENRGQLRTLYQDPAVRSGLCARLRQERALDFVVQRANARTVARVAAGEGSG